jgi:DNA-directed RNA polymerase subunit RPC12/RpoP
MSKFEIIAALSFPIIFILLYFLGRVKCVKCGHKGILKEKNSKLYCEKCGFDYGYVDQ